MNPIEVKEALAILDVHPAKIDFALALAYLEVERVDKAIPLLEGLQALRHEYEQSLRLKGDDDRRRAVAGLKLGASPYFLQLRELNQVGWMLGKAYHLMERDDDSISALEAFLESTRRQGLGDDSIDREVRFQALNLLSELHLDRAHRQEKLMRRLRGNLEGGPAYLAAKKKRTFHLKGARRYLRELYSPEYQVYGLEEQLMRYVESCVKLGYADEALSLARSFEAPDLHKRNEMKLWEVQAMLQKDKNALVIPTLYSIAGDNTRRFLRLAAFVMMGDLQVQRKEVDKTLGVLLEANKDILYMPTIGAYEKAATMFEEKEFDENPMVDKFTLINSLMKRAHTAEQESDEDLAIRLYRFLLKEFTVQKASLIQGVAKLQRIKGRELVEKEGGLNKESRRWFKVSGESYLYTEDSVDVPYDKLASEQALFQAGESFFEGGHYTKAYEMYGRFLKNRPEDPRVSKARHKRGVSALYRKGYNDNGERHPRFEDARREFIANISKDVRGMDGSNGELSVNLQEPDGQLELDALVNRYGIEKPDIVPMLKGTADIPALMAKYKLSIADLTALNKAKEDPFVMEALKKKYLDKPMTAAQDPMAAAKSLFYLKEILGDEELGSRDIWAYNSLLQLGNTYYAQHKYEEASMVYTRIKRDGRFSPSSEVWRKGAYELAKLRWDQAYEDLIPWREAIEELEDLLMLYDLKTYSSRFSLKDQELYQTFRRDNAHLKYLLARAFYKNGDAKSSIKHARELLTNSEHFALDLKDNRLEDEQLATVQKTEALLADALYLNGDYTEAMEHYRRAHDRHLGSAERPFYSLNIVDCLVGLDRKAEAIDRLKQIKWEFDQFYRPDSLVLKNVEGFDKESWIGLVDARLARLESL
jgi:hypothetical protein